MTFNPRARLYFDFDASSKEAVNQVLDKFSDDSIAIYHMRNALAIPGPTTLHADEALMLAGLLLPWYASLSRRIVEHPGFAPEKVVSEDQDSNPV